MGSDGTPFIFDISTSRQIQGAILIIAKLISPILAVLIMSMTCSAADKRPASSEEKDSLPVTIQQKADIEYMLGYDNELHGKWEEAMTNYSNALKNDPSSAYMKTQIGRMLEKLGRIPEAITM